MDNESGSSCIQASPFHHIFAPGFSSASHATRVSCIKYPIQTICFFKVQFELVRLFLSQASLLVKLLLDFLDTLFNWFFQFFRLLLTILLHLIVSLFHPIKLVILDHLRINMFVIMLSVWKPNKEDSPAWTCTYPPVPSAFSHWLQPPRMKKIKLWQFEAVYHIVTICLLYFLANCELLLFSRIFWEGIFFVGQFWYITKMTFFVQNLFERQICSDILKITPSE